MNASLTPLPSCTLLISAMASGQGKTTVTAALARRCVRAGQRVRVFKTGPDFIDPLLLAQASGSPVETLDLWMVGEEGCRALLAQAAAEVDVVLIEGVMGLYDGQPSAADLARRFGIPVLAVLDAAAMAQTVGAVAQGLRDYGPVNLVGVIANRVASPGHAQMASDAMRDIPLLGTLPRQPQGLPERHLGLLLPGEVPHLDRLLDSLAESLSVDGTAWPIRPPVSAKAHSMPGVPSPNSLTDRVVAVARDAAFAFHYPANLGLLADLGAHIVWFSPLKDEPVPDGADAVYVPGGYPELHAQVLSQARRWQSSIQSAHARGVPIWAECGGMMALTQSLVDHQGHSWPMAGLLEGHTRMQSSLAALGLQAWETPQGELRGHAFHYSTCDTPLTPLAYARKHPSGGVGEAVYRCGSLTASYFHAYFPSCPEAITALLTGAEA